MRSHVERMTAVLERRGPDDFGSFVNEGGTVALGHRRLSVVDLSPAGHQPMVSTSGRYVIVFNGEIYNHGELRQQISGIRFRGHSDTEVLVACFDSWGIEETLRRARGMFALAVWDSVDECVVLARDRLGEKPLYHGWIGQGALRTWVFASEISALRAHPAFRAPINHSAVASYLRYGYVPAPQSIFEGICKLQPGELYRMPLRQGKASSTKYWDLLCAITLGSGRSSPMSAADAVEELDVLLNDAIRSQMLADVPLGAFLSGGVDSSTVVALMQKNSSKPIRTFTVGFAEDKFNEAHHAKQISNHLGTDHTELFLTSDDALSVVPRLCSIYDEPFADSSQIAVHLISQLARTQVTVSLSGDGGDELFGGYNRYRVAKDVWPTLSAIPVGMRAAISAIANALPTSVYNFIETVSPFGWSDHLADRVQKIAAVLPSRSIAELHSGLTSQWTGKLPLLDDSAVETAFAVALPAGLPAAAEMMAVDALTYLPDDILVKVDRAAMAVSLETRTPFLDHRVVEFAFALPLDFKLRSGNGRASQKWLLRQVLNRYVPENLFSRPKMGFSIPLASWLRGPLRDWADDLLSAHSLERSGLFDREAISHAWSAHRNGTRNRQYQLWPVLMFQAWYLNSFNG